MRYKSHYHHKKEQPSDLLHFTAIIAGLKQMVLTPIFSLCLILLLTLAITAATAGYLFQQNINSLRTRWNESAKISLYLKKGVSLKAADELTKKIQASSVVTKITLIQPAAGMEYFKENTAISTILTNFKENPLPHVIIIHPKVKLLTPSTTAEFIQILKNYPAVELVKANVAWIDRSHNLLTLWDTLSLIVVLALSINALLIIGGSSYLATKVFIASGRHTLPCALPYQFAWYGCISSVTALVLVRLGLIFIQHHNLFFVGLDVKQGILIVVISTLVGMICSKSFAKKPRIHS